MPAKPRRPWVAGWSSQLVLLVCSGAASYLSSPQMAATFAVGATVIGAVRQIEKERRDRG